MEGGGRRAGSGRLLRDMEKGVSASTRCTQGQTGRGLVPFTEKQASMGHGTECKIHMGFKVKRGTSKKFHVIK